MQQIDVQRRGKIRGQPGQEKIKSVIVGRETEGQPPNFTLAQQITEGRPFGGARAILWLRSAAGDELALRIREEFIFARVPVKGVEERKIKKADESRRRKIPSPAKINQQESEQRYSNCRRKL